MNNNHKYLETLLILVMMFSFSALLSQTEVPVGNAEQENVNQPIVVTQHTNLDRSNDVERKLAELRDQITDHSFNDDDLPSTRSSIGQTAEANWTQFTGDGPTYRRGFSMAYNPTYDTVILFGGVSHWGYIFHNDTWRYDFSDNAWTLETNYPDGHPAPSHRAYHAMAYDNSSNKFILFGGRNSYTYFDDTWSYQWDQGFWMQEDPGTGPLPRAGHAMVYNSERQTVVMVGGTGITAPVSNVTEYGFAAGSTLVFREFWEYSSIINRNEGTWTKIEVDPTSWGVMPLGKGMSLSYDAGNNKILSFGGSTGLSYQTRFVEWDYDTGAWVPRNPTGLPPRMAYMGMVWDPNTNLTVLFGGYGGGYMGVGFSGVTWAYNYTSNSWKQLQFDVAPAPRSFLGLVYASNSSQLFLFGGWGSSSSNSLIKYADTWFLNISDLQLATNEMSTVQHSKVSQPNVVYTLDDWTEQTTTNKPSVRIGYEIEYIAGQNKAILFGGEAVADLVYLNDTWIYDFSAGSWTEVTDNAPPTSRSDYAMVYDPDSEVVVMFGGVGEAGELNDTWLFDITDNTWSQVPQSNTITPRQTPQMVYNSQRDKVVLVGGTSYISGRYLTDFWEFDQSTGIWTNITIASTSSGPKGAGYQIVYDGKADSIIAFGGNEHEGYSDITYSWDYGTNTWSMVETSDSPPAMSWFGLVYDPSTSLIILHGGYVGEIGAVSDGTWTFNATSSSWVEVDVDSVPNARIARSMTINSEDGLLFLFGGDDGSVVYGDMWVLDTTNFGVDADETSTISTSTTDTTSTTETATANFSPVVVVLFSGFTLMVGRKIRSRHN